MPQQITAISQRIVPRSVADGGEAAALDLEARDRRILEQPGTVLARPLGQCHARIRRAQGAIGGDIERAIHMIDGHEGKERLRFLRRYQLHLDAEGARRRDRPFVLAPAVSVGSHPHATGLPPAGGLAGLRL